MEINRQTLEQFRRDFIETVKSLEDKYDVDVLIGHITYELNSFQGQLKVRKRGLDNSEWNWYCTEYGLTAEDFGKTFKYNHKTYTIVGIKRGSKYPIMTKREDGKAFGFTADVVKNAL